MNLWSTSEVHEIYFIKCQLKHKGNSSTVFTKSLTFNVCYICSFFIFYYGVFKYDLVTLNVSKIRWVYWKSI